jgi:hypothetical protein
MTPLMTLKKLMRPAKGSVMVLKTTRPAGSLSSTLRVDFPASSGDRPAASMGIADGDGRALDGRGRVDLDEVEQVVEGHVGQAAGEEHREDAVFADGFVERGDEVLLVMVPFSKYSSISSSLPSATSSTSASWRVLASAARLAGISPVTLPRPSPPGV